MISGTAGGPGRRAGSARGAAAWGWCAVAPEGVWEARARRAEARGGAAGWSPFTGLNTGAFRSLNCVHIGGRVQKNKPNRLFFQFHKPNELRLDSVSKRARQLTKSFRSCPCATPRGTGTVHTRTVPVERSFLCTQRPHTLTSAYKDVKKQQTRGER